MGGSGLQWSFSGKPNSPSKILSFTPASEGGNHSIYAPGFVQKVVSADKNGTSSLVNRQTQSYGALINHSRDVLKVSTVSGHVKACRLVGSPLNSPSPVVSNGINGVGSRANPESLGSAYKVPSSLVSPMSSAVVGSTNLSNESLFNGPTQMTIFYNGLVCVYDDVAPDKAQAIMLLAGNGNSRTQKPTEPAVKAQPHVVPSPPKAVEVISANPSSSNRVSEPSSGLSKPAHVVTPNDPVSVGACTSTSEVNSRNPTSKFSTPKVVSKYLPQSALVDPVSAVASTSKVEVNPPNPVSKFPTTSNQNSFPQSVVPIDPVSTGASTRTVEINPRNPGLRYPSPTTGPTGISRFRFSQSAITIDPVIAGACESPKNPASKFPPPSTGSTGPNQIRFSQSVPVRASTGRSEVGSNNPATKFPPAATSSAGSTQIRFSQSAHPIDPVSSGASIAPTEANPKHSTSSFPPSGSQIRFSRAAFPIDPGSSDAPISIVESNPIKATTKFPETSTTSGSNKFRYPQSTSALINPNSTATPIDPVSTGASNSNAERNTVKPATNSGSNQFRFSQTATPIERTSDSASNCITERKPIIMPTTKLSDPTTGSGSHQIQFTKSATQLSIDRASSGASNSTAEVGAAKPASNSPTPGKGTGEPNQLRFSHSGVPLARKISLARFLQKRKDRPAGEGSSFNDLPPAKFRSNSG